MKKIKHILFFFLVLFSMSQMVGHDLIRYCDNMPYAVENNQTETANGSISPESSGEEDHLVFLSLISEITIQYHKENLGTIALKLPLEGYHSIWLPPDKV